MNIPFSSKYASIFLLISYQNLPELSGLTRRRALFHPGHMLLLCCMSRLHTVYHTHPKSNNQEKNEKVAFSLIICKNPPQSGESCLTYTPSWGNSCRTMTRTSQYHVCKSVCIYIRYFLLFSITLSVCLETSCTYLVAIFRLA